MPTGAFAPRSGAASLRAVTEACRADRPRVRAGPGCPSRCPRRCARSSTGWPCTRARGAAAWCNRITRRLGQTAAFARVYRVVGPKIDPKIGAIKDGRYLATVYGFPILMLHHIGAKSGQERVSPGVVRDGDDFALVGTTSGRPSTPRGRST